MKSKQSKRGDHRSNKVGSDPEAAKKVGGEGDFGVRADDKIGREYASHETKWNDPGAAQTRINDGEGARESGVGSYDSGPGSGSGGDIDVDIIGIRSSLPDSGSQRSDDSNPKTNPDSSLPIPLFRGSTVNHSGGDLSTTGGGLDNGSASNPEAQGDDSFAADSFAADIQLDDATGENDESSED